VGGPLIAKKGLEPASRVWSHRGKRQGIKESAGITSIEGKWGSAGEERGEIIFTERKTRAENKNFQNIGPKTKKNPRSRLAKECEGGKIDEFFQSENRGAVDWKCIGHNEGV